MEQLLHYVTRLITRQVTENLQSGEEDNPIHHASCVIAPLPLQARHLPQNFNAMPKSASHNHISGVKIWRRKDDQSDQPPCGLIDAPAHPFFWWTITDWFQDKLDACAYRIAAYRFFLRIQRPTSATAREKRINGAAPHQQS